MTTHKLWLFSPAVLLAGLAFVPVGGAADPGGPKLWHALDLAGMDRARKPWDDFYEYANGTWLKSADIPPDKAMVYVFTLLDDQNRRTLHAVLEEAARDKDAPADGVRGKVGAFFRSGMDEAAVEKAGATPLKEELGRLAAVKGPADVLPALARLHLLGVGAGFNFGSTPDAKDSARTIAGFSQGGLGLPDRDFYLKDDDKAKATRAAYVAHVTKMLGLLGNAPDAAAKDAQTVLAFETRLAKASRSRVDLRDPHLNYHLVSRADFEKETAGVDWAPYFDALGLGGLKELDLGQPDFLKELGHVVKEVPAGDWRTYLRWHLLDSYAASLSPPFVDEDFHFKGTVLTGTPRNRPRWQRVVQATDRLLGEALGQLYVAKAFPPEAKAKALALVQNVKGTLRERLATLDWMSPTTRKEALKKLDAITVKIGYPDRWRDYTGLKVDGDAAYARNVMAANAFAARFDLDKIGKPVDKGEWGMTPPTVNAYYNPSHNEIVFPAGILQPPFFDPNADDAVNYGAIGMVIGHELTHGFDDQGRKFDAAGNLRDWWQPADEKAYKERAARIAAQYSAYSPAEGLHINGELTLGENIADLGGLRIAYLALQKTRAGKHAEKVQGFTPEQRFFLAFAQLWRGLMRPAALRLMVQTNPHSPARFRVLGPLYNLPEFFEAFGATPEDARGRLNPHPVEIW